VGIRPNGILVSRVERSECCDAADGRHAPTVRRPVRPDRRHARRATAGRGRRREGHRRVLSPPGRATPSGSSRCVAVAAVGIAAFLLLGGDTRRPTSRPRPRLRRPRVRRSSKSSSSSSKSTVVVVLEVVVVVLERTTDADVQKKMLTGKEVRSDLRRWHLHVGQHHPDLLREAESQSDNPADAWMWLGLVEWVASFQEEAAAYASASDAQKVADLIKDETTCPSPTSPRAAHRARRAEGHLRESDDTGRAGVEIDFETTEATGQFFVIKDTVAVVTFTFAAQKGTERASCPWPSTS